MFIVSTGRAGSNMLAKVLAHHPDLIAFHEPRPQLNAEALARWRGSHSVGRIRAKIKSKRSWLIEQAGWNQCTYVESSHFCSHLIEDLHAMHNARFIHLHRDGRAFVRSGLERDWWYPERRTAIFGDKHSENNLFKRWIRRKFLTDIGFSSDDHRLDPPRYMKSRVEKISWLWVEINSVIMNQMAYLPTDAYTSISLNSFSRNEVEKLLRFIGASDAEEVVGPMMRAASHRPNRTRERRIPPFNEWEDEQKQRFWKIAGPLMTELGYS